jgi:hypothetical protein
MTENELSFGKLLESLKSIERNNTLNKVTFGHILYMIKNDKLYKTSYKYWNDFLKDYGISFGEANDYINLYKELKQYSLEYTSIPLRVLRKMRKVINKDNAIDIINIANSLPYHDFVNEINILKGKYKSNVECTHEESEDWKKCKVCGKWHKKETN